MANRIGTHKQRFLTINDTDPDILHHRRLAEEIYRNNGLMIRTDVGSVSGIMLLFAKDTWLKVGGFKETGMLGVDTDFSKKISGRGWKIGILQGLYATHYYRMMEGDGEHLKIRRLES
jgi:GT2 family glycosyltransferase